MSGNKKCVMCKRAALQQLMSDNQISREAFAEAMGITEFDIKRSPHRIRMVCSERCWNELRGLMEAVRQENKKKENPAAPVTNKRSEYLQDEIEKARERFRIYLEPKDEEEKE